MFKINSVGSETLIVIMQIAENIHVNTETYCIFISALVLLTPILDIIANTMALPNANIFPIYIIYIKYQ